MRVLYKYMTLPDWIRLHKANCDQMLSKDGFMVALRYDIKMRANTWQFKLTVNGVKYILDFSKVRQDTYKEAYSQARANGELIFKTVNPYATGGPGEKWEAVTGTCPARTTTPTPALRVVVQQTAPSQAAPALPAKSNPTKPQPVNNPGYQESNFNPNFRNRVN
ncbi:hypothetical protein Pst134EB_004077 [Puccinia striiformis f. sp. tritici]|uniref:Uncharacterized protein n=1 Tax=Puccinia striiformis f. sp. tritici PST-78 TaxID=1165861 RepID=A0A0L0W4G7_9BASI|nr:hypothetical protein Pst134EB_004077 [Puccinia striiformis f. sp. tritici]KNF06399.1 hypothetical protein PSTG_00282 [Puccinia striiformis f. sp. tritici PST-78]